MDEVEASIEKLGSEDQKKRVEAIYELGLSGDPRAVVPLIGALADKNEEAACIAAMSLGKLGDKSAVEPLIAVVKKCDGSTLGSNAIWALGQLKDASAVETLCNVLVGKGKTEEKVEAAYALGKIGGRKALMFLELRTRPRWIGGERNKNVRKAIGDAIERIREAAKEKPEEKKKLRLH